MNKKFNKDMVRLTKQIRKLGLKYPEARIKGYTGRASTAAQVIYSEREPKKGEKCYFTSYNIDEDGKFRFVKTN